MLRANVLVPRARWPMALPWRWLWRVWTLPTNVVGHLAGLIVSGRGPRRVGNGAARGWVYPIRPGIGLDWVGAVTLGHVILHSRTMFEGRTGRFVLAHELAHTRQHDWLGPSYLPLHILAQSVSALISLVARGPVHSRVHDHNPLEQTFICLGASAYGPLARGESVRGRAGDAATSSVEGDAMLAAFGV